MRSRFRGQSSADAVHLRSPGCRTAGGSEEKTWVKEFSRWPRAVVPAIHARGCGPTPLDAVPGVSCSVSANPIGNTDAVRGSILAHAASRGGSNSDATPASEACWSSVRSRGFLKRTADSSRMSAESSMPTMRNRRRRMRSCASSWQFGCMAAPGRELRCGRRTRQPGSPSSRRPGPDWLNAVAKARHVGIAPPLSG